MTADEAQALLDNATPGPWAVEGPDDDLWVMNAGRSYSVAMLGSRAVDVDVEANAELIAAAPDLAATVIALAAELEYAQLQSIEARNPGIDMDVVRAMRAATPPFKVCPTCDHRWGQHDHIGCGCKPATPDPEEKT